MRSRTARTDPHVPLLARGARGLRCAGALVLLAAACGKSPASSPAATAPAPAAPSATATVPFVSAQAKSAAETIFTSRCVTCHGTLGKGDGSASAGLTPPPRNFTDPAWQASVTDEHLLRIVMYGGAAVGKSPMMPPNPDLVAKKDVVAAIAAHIRSLNGR